MKKYTKHYIEMAFFKQKFDEFFFEEDEIEARDIDFLKKYFFDQELSKTLIQNKYSSKRYVVKYPEVITSGRPLAKIRFYDISYIVDNDITYKSIKHNYSNWICFGKRLNILGNPQEEECWCCNGENNFIMKKEDITYNEFVTIYLNQLQNSNKVKKLR